MGEVIDFVVPVNLTGSAPVDVMQQDPPAGPAEVEIFDVKLVTKEGEGGKTTLRVNVTIIEGPAKGLTTQVVIGTDWTKPFSVGHLMNLLHGLHDAQGRFADAAKLTGVMELKPSIFKGKRAYIYTKRPPEGEIDENTGRPARANKNFVTKPQYEQAKAAESFGTPAPSVAARGNGHAPGPIAPAPASAPVAVAQTALAVSLTDLFNS